MSRRNIVLLAVVLALGGLNLLNWLAGDAGLSRPRPADSMLAFKAEDFRVRAVAKEGQIAAVAKRDLFKPRIVAAAPKPAPKSAQPALPPPKTAEELEEEAARAELALFKFVGVVFRNDKGQAFFVKGDQVILAGVGDKIGERFVLEKIATDSALLADRKTGVSGQLPISGS